VDADRDLVLALTADEEGGDANGVEFLLAKHRALIDAAYAVNEGGGGSLAPGGADARPLFHSVQAAEKVPEDYTVTVTNPGGHSSVPRPRQRDLPADGGARPAGAAPVPGGAQPGLARLLREHGEGRGTRDGGGDAGRGREPRRHGGGGDRRPRPALQLDAAHLVRRDAPRGRARVQRAAADGDGERELPHRPDVDARGGDGHAGARRRRHGVR
jgi:acetylornithine deacetylase/succinyl-diaminopimelate desuccinylase-like protein